MNLPLILGGAVALYYFTKKKEAPKASVPKDKGFVILIPGKQFSIENEEASQIYAYELAKANAQLSAFAILQKMIEVNESQYHDLAYHPNYYSWLYRVYRAVLKGLVEKNKMTAKDAGDILDETLDSLKAAGLETQGLPTSLVGGFEQ